MMSKTPRHEPEDSLEKKFPGLAAPKPLKSISVERSLDSDEKTVIETHYDDNIKTTKTPPKYAPEPTLQPAPGLRQTSTKKPKRSEKDAEVDDTVLELPPSPQHRKASRRKVGIIATATSVALLAGGWALLYFSPLLAIEDITHEGLDLVAESEAAERTAVLTGTPLPQVNDDAVTKLFADTPAVDDVSLRAEPPHGLVVIVNEHTPVAMSPRGKQYVVFSETGNELAEIPAKRAQEFDLPVVASASDVADQEIFATITEVLGSLPDDLRDQVRAASGASMDSIELELSSGKTVMWGNTEQAEKKILVLEALLGLDDEQAAEISEYDVSAPDFPVTR